MIKNKYLLSCNANRFCKQQCWWLESGIGYLSNDNPCWRDRIFLSNPWSLGGQSWTQVWAVKGVSNHIKFNGQGKMTICKCRIMSKTKTSLSPSHPPSLGPTPHQQHGFTLPCYLCQYQTLICTSYVKYVFHLKDITNCNMLYPHAMNI